MPSQASGYTWGDMIVLFCYGMKEQKGSIVGSLEWKYFDH